MLVSQEPKGAASRRPRSRAADDLVIAGLVPMSTVDWPDHLTATVFLQGCPWNCFYCHNQALIPTRTPGAVAWDEVRALLGRRRGLLDGVAREVAEAGFRVGLHTAGAYPRRLRDLLDSGLISWVGLDVKALPEHYEAVVGRPSGGAKAWESLRVLLEAEVPFEVRTTVVPGDVTADDAVEVARTPPASAWPRRSRHSAGSGSPTGRREGIRGAASEPARPDSRTGDITGRNQRHGRPAPLGRVRAAAP